MITSNTNGLGENGNASKQISIDINTCELWFAKFLRSCGQDQRSYSITEKVFKWRENNFGPEHELTLLVLEELAESLPCICNYSEMEKVCRRWVDSSQKLYGKAHIYTCKGYACLARSLAYLQRYDEAESLYESIKKNYEIWFRVEDPSTVSMESWHNQALMLQSQGKLKEAERLYLQSLSASRKLSGRDHPESLITALSLGGIYLSQDRYKEAEAILLDTYERRKRILGSYHRDTIVAEYLYAKTLMKLNKYDEAEVKFRNALMLQIKTLGPEDENTLITLRKLMNLFISQAKYDEGEEIYTFVLGDWRKRLGSDPVGYQNHLLYALARIYSEQGKDPEAEIMFRSCVETETRFYGPWDSDTLNMLYSLGICLYNQSKYEEAEGTFRSCLHGEENVYGPQNSNTLETLYYLALCLYNQSKYEEAESTFRLCLHGDEHLYGPEDGMTLITVRAIGDALDCQRKYHEAGNWYHRYLSGLVRLRNPDRRLRDADESESEDESEDEFEDTIVLYYEKYEDMYYKEMVKEARSWVDSSTTVTTSILHIRYMLYAAAKIWIRAGTAMFFSQNRLKRVVLAITPESKLWLIGNLRSKTTLEHKTVPLPRLARLRRLEHKNVRFLGYPCMK